MTRELRQPHDRSIQLSSTLSWLVDAACEAPGADRLLAELGARLVADGLPLAGGALTLAVPHPLIARRTWLWRAESGEVIEALGFVPGGFVAGRARGRGSGEPARRCRPALARWTGGRPRARGRRRVEAGRAFARLDRAASVHTR